MLAIWSLVPLSFLKPAWHLEVHASHNVEASLWEFWALLCSHVRWVQLCNSTEHSLALPFFGIGIKTDLFQSFGHCWVFPNLLAYWNEQSTFTASFFKIWNSSTGISSPPLALFIVIFPKTHLTSHFRMSASRWVITPSWLPLHESQPCHGKEACITQWSYEPCLQGPPKIDWS